MDALLKTVDFIQGMCYDFYNGFPYERKKER